MRNCPIILQLHDGAIFIGWVDPERFLDRLTFVLLVDRNYHHDGLDTVLIAHKAVAEFEVIA